MDDVLEVLLFHIIAFFTLSFALITIVCCHARINAVATPTPVELPLPEQLEVGDATDVDEPPAYDQDEGGERLILVLLPGVAQNTGGSNLGRPHQQSSTLLPMYMDGSDRRIVLLPTVRGNWQS